MDRARYGFLVFCLALLGCDRPTANGGTIRVGTLSDPDIKESSGLAASRRHPGVVWTHNDGGGPKRHRLYAVTREGRTRAVFQVTGVAMQDWEDLAVGADGFLYLADIGNNDAKRDRLFVHRVAEPDPAAGKGALSPDRTWELRFPGAAFDCESLFIHGDHGYVISKVFDDAQAGLYRFSLVQLDGPQTLEHVSTLPVTSPVTAADLSADGNRLGLVSKSWAYVFDVKGDLAGAGAAPFHRSRAPDKDLEGCCFVNDGLLAAAESRRIFLFDDMPFVTGTTP